MEHGSAAPTPMEVDPTPENAIEATLIGQATEIAHATSTECDCLVTLRAMEHEDDARASIDLTTVVDVSGSMAGAKLALAKKTLKFIVKNLRSGDRLAIVAYSSSIEVALALTEMGAAGKVTAIGVIDALRTKGCTNLSGGLFAGLDIVNKRVKPNEVSSVLLMTDGQANEGITDLAGITRAMTGPYRATLESTTVYTFGYGTDHNAELLKGISEAGNGMYTFIEKEDQIVENFAICLGGLMSVVAQNITIEFTALGDTTLGNIHSTKPVTRGPDDRTASLCIGDIQSEEIKDLLFVVNIPALSAPRDFAPLVKTTISFFDIVNNKLTTLTRELELSRPAVPRGQVVPKRITEQKMQLQATAAMLKADRWAKASDFSSARRELEQAKSALTPMRGEKWADMLFEDLVECQESSATSSTYAAFGSKKCHAISQMYSHQRQNCSKDSAFITKKKKGMKTASKAYMAEEE